LWQLREEAFDLLVQPAQCPLQARPRVFRDTLGKRRELAAEAARGVDRLPDLRLDVGRGSDALPKALHREPLEPCPLPERQHRLLVLLPRYADQDVAGDGRVGVVFILDRLRQARERQRVADVRAALVQQIGDLGVRVTLRLDQRGDAERFLERRQILTLQVLDHGDLERMVVAYQSRNRAEAG